jgi:hypothetical protein
VSPASKILSPRPLHLELHDLAAGVLRRCASGAYWPLLGTMTDQRRRVHVLFQLRFYRCTYERAALLTIQAPAEGR